MGKVKVLFVCMGNICRSPTAEGVFSQLVSDRQLTERFFIDSAGTHAYHAGEQPDPRAQQAAKKRGVELGHIRARKVKDVDFEEFHHILAMDKDNFMILMEACPQEHQHKVELFLSYAPELGIKEVPDPYYGGRYGFERVLDLVESASLGFIETLTTRGML